MAHKVASSRAVSPSMISTTSRPRDRLAGRDFCSRSQTSANVPASLEILEERPNALVRLICFPWAGGEAVKDYRALKLSQALPDFVEVVGFRWAGRGRRHAEPSWTGFGWIPGEAQACIAFLTEKPFAFFGHSMGSSAAYEWARWLTLNTSLRPIHLFVSGTVPPQLHVELLKMGVGGLSRDEQCKKIHFLSGTPIAVLKANNYQALKAILPVLSADLDLADTYKDELRSRSDCFPTLTCNITASVGDSDHLNHGNMERWREVTAGSTVFQTFPGRHFYFRERKETFGDLTAAVARTLARETTPASKL
ncbi:S-acyl fatty acid synthase thioesterase, medium chain-like [Sycon ciliatum]|uniref:S-acyl fatty acid synthase thioesterase, medium chain-like n=1 Tax=Sycon ciliatum TaxID=27933 RepID=UPI0031F6BD3E|eukprot:scpid73003/ scgid14688/ S-acyl fatty acid synthase thioesterase, medium chain; Thioesterase II